MIIDKDKERLPVNTHSTIKLAGLGKDSEVQQKARPQETQVNTEKNPSDHPTNDKMVRAELEWSVPMCVPLPIEVLNHDQAFPFLNTTLADLGIEE